MQDQGRCSLGGTHRSSVIRSFLLVLAGPGDLNAVLYNAGDVVGNGKPLKAVVTGCAGDVFRPLTATRAHDLVPTGRLIVLLRDPVARAYSHYQHNVRGGRERLGFEAALDAEDSRLANDREQKLEGEIDASATR